MSTLNDWLERHPQLAPQLEQARETARRKVLAMIRSIGEESSDWRALDTWLQRSFPSDYRRDANTKVEVNATAQSGVVSLEEQARLRQRLIEQQKRIRAPKQEGQRPLPSSIG